MRLESCLFLLRRISYQDLWRVESTLACAEFHPRMLGLTGSKEQTSAAAKAYRVYFTKANETEKDYLIDHSIISYLVDPSGDFVAFYGKNSDAETMVKEISDHIKHWAPQK